MIIHGRRYLTVDESALLRYELRIASGARTIKRGLQRLCMFYEAKRKLEDPSDHRQLIHSHMSCEDVVLRRWSLKALGLIGDRDDRVRIVKHLRIEHDLEAQTWGIAALLKNADDRTMTEVCREAGIENTTPLLLAARLYAPSHWILHHWTPVTVSLDTDDLTLKWAIFLAGYNRAPAELFHPRFANRIFLGQLNQHDSPEVSEYSIWALWERPDFGASDLTIPLERARQRPENARKWLYRLYMQAPLSVGLDPDALGEFRKDESIPAREGLALGVVDLHDASFDQAVMEWYDEESDLGIRDTLLTAMAGHSDGNADFADLVQRRFSAAAPDSALRPRLLAASERTGLYQKLKRMELDSEYARQGLLQFGQAANIRVEGDLFQMAESNIVAGGNIVAQNIVGGNMLNSANDAVQSIGPDRQQDRAVLEQVLDFLKSKPLPPGQQSEIETAVQAAAQESGSSSRRRLLDVLQSTAKTAALAGPAAAGLAKLVEVVHQWIK